MNKQATLQKAFQYVDDHFEEMIEELKNACSFRSVYSDRDGIKKTCEYILKKMNSLGLHPQKIDVEDHNPLLFGEKKGKIIKHCFFTTIMMS